MNPSRTAALSIALGGLLVLGGCVAVPAGSPVYADNSYPVYSGGYAGVYQEPYPVYSAPPVVLGISGGYVNEPRYYGPAPGYYGRPGYGPRPGYAPRPGYGPRPGIAPRPGYGHGGGRPPGVGRPPPVGLPTPGGPRPDQIPGVGRPLFPEPGQGSIQAPGQRQRGDRRNQ